MSRPESPDHLAAANYELPDDGPYPRSVSSFAAASTTRSSPYRLATGEQLRGVANRIIFSRYYILFYFIMMVLSLTTVVMSLIATSASASMVSKLTHRPP